MKGSSQPGCYEVTLVKEWVPFGHNCFLKTSGKSSIEQSPALATLLSVDQELVPANSVMVRREPCYLKPWITGVLCQHSRDADGSNLQFFEPLPDAFSIVNINLWLRGGILYQPRNCLISDQVRSDILF